MHHLPDQPIHYAICSIMKSNCHSRAKDIVWASTVVHELCQWLHRIHDRRSWRQGRSQSLEITRGSNQETVFTDHIILAAADPGICPNHYRWKNRWWPKWHRTNDDFPESHAIVELVWSAVNMQPYSYLVVPKYFLMTKTIVFCLLEDDDSPDHRNTTWKVMESSSITTQAYRD